MARNRKQQTPAVRFGPALRALLLCLLIGGSAFGYVWQKSQLLQLSRQRLERETRLGELRKRNREMTQLLAELQSPKSIERLALELQLGLAPASPTQLIHVVDVFHNGVAAVPAPMTPHESQYAGPTYAP